MRFQNLIILFIAVIFSANLYAEQTTPEFWKNATVYFMLTDRFNNGDTTNDHSYNRTEKSATLRGFEGGDIKGIIEKIEDGYFTRLGVDAIWMTPLIEQVHGYDDSSGLTYSYHGYWPKDWTAVDDNFGTEADLQKMISLAHKHNIKVLMDVIINHTGPETKSDWAWPKDWIRTTPLCKWNNYKENTQCALATSLTDIKTESDAEVKLPPKLLKKWQDEGRLELELSELDTFFSRTGYPRAPKYYIVKWLTDWVKEYGVDGFRVDTAKHVEADIWTVLKKESELAFSTWKKNSPKQVMDDVPFYMVGEVFNWGLNGYKNTAKNGRSYDYGDKQVDFFEHGFDALINMGFVAHASQPAEQIFSSYSQSLNGGVLDGLGVLSYIGSHDDPDSYDIKREKTFDTAFKLMLAPGGVQIYYGDELARPMHAKDAFGDANMRTFMNWEDLTQSATQDILAHWQKLGKFRQAHDSVGSGKHKILNKTPYIFKREFGTQDKVLVAKGLSIGNKNISVYKLFKNGDVLFDYYSNQEVIVINGKISLSSEFTYLLLGKAK
ncbi:alpha-amylase family glycosyl hydrolase [Colwellia sp. 12G3]|uniref:alpha-amylase family glycosyl hydrolase n=1 Tax=Colwellia sp. 12G3 TaxID=2058299 RepID=UPI000C330521|nr:alpha-amylase family glycosyl hydrolase [Colwellia sp. 12G3]PKI17204.1 alpha-amlyase [Colwellia sp. 12G3]